MGLIDAKNKVPEQQRYYQQAYKAHTRIWMIPVVHDTLPCYALGWFWRFASSKLKLSLSIPSLTLSSRSVHCWAKSHRPQHLVRQELTRKLQFDS
ncbi:hypothetical protein E4U59_006400 [Claviceps monticola]|nr:hypothetical protein E4U59_006400 [Claviceps monticola]